MGYFIEIEETLPYLNSADRNFSQRDRDVVFDFLAKLEVYGEKYCADPSFRCSPGSPNMLIPFLFMDSAGKLRHLRFIVTDAAAAYGVLRVTYVDEY
jgi:hypothetical protein